MRVSFLSLELGGDITTKALSAVVLDAGRQCERERHCVRPLWILRVEVRRWARRAQQALTELARIHLGARPLARMPDEAGGYRIRDDVGDLFHHCRSCKQPHHAGGFVIPYRPVPFTEHFRAESDDAMEKLQKAREDAIHIGHDEVQMR
ncbi:hypothetical protein BE15_00985 [Sorangium cellulosum]|uniref:Uncharacterized protein n=1 Tax=Sorangium cellulosum TaxID=56 RepID=A0A150QXB7_SORCE|nr:hypothetical protein BE15_00985 [Sorangium cellulosum]